MTTRSQFSSKTKKMRKENFKKIKGLPGAKVRWSRASGITEMEEQLLAVLDIRARHLANDRTYQRKKKLHEQWVDQALAAYRRKQKAKL